MKRAWISFLLFAAAIAAPRFVAQAQSVPDLSGHWICTCRPGPASIVQTGQQLRFTNEVGGVSRGHFVDARTVIADDWEGGLRGALSADNRTISWANGTTWKRVGPPPAPSIPPTGVCPNFAGTWDTGYGRLAFVESGGNLHGTYTYYKPPANHLPGVATIAGVVANYTLTGTFTLGAHTSKLRFSAAHDWRTLVGSSVTSNGTPMLASTEWHASCISSQATPAKTPKPKAKRSPSPPKPSATPKGIDLSGSWVGKATYLAPKGTVKWHILIAQKKTGTFTGTVTDRNTQFGYGRAVLLGTVVGTTIKNGAMLCVDQTLGASRLLNATIVPSGKNTLTVNSACTMATTIVYTRSTTAGTGTPPPGSFPSPDPNAPACNGTYAGAVAVLAKPCFGPPGSLVTVIILRTTKSPLDSLAFTRGIGMSVIDRIVVKLGPPVGSRLGVTAPPKLCAGPFPHTWAVYLYDAKGHSQGEIGSYTMTNC